MAMMKGEAAMQRVRQGAGAEDFPYGPSAPALPLLTRTPGGGQSHGTALVQHEALSPPDGSELGPAPSHQNRAADPQPCHPPALCTPPPPCSPRALLEKAVSGDVCLGLAVSVPFLPQPKHTHTFETRRKAQTVGLVSKFTSNPLTHNSCSSDNCSSCS